MRIWLLALGPMLVWTLHFLGLYVIASLEAQHRDPAASQWAVIAFSAVCLIAVAASTLAAAFSTRDGAAWMLTRLGVASGGLALIAVVWQTAATLMR